MWLDGHAEDVAIEDYHQRRCGMVKKRIPPVHPGAYLKELLDELALSQYRLAKDIGVPAMRINYVVNHQLYRHKERETDLSAQERISR
jgi:hypothetical protein